MDTPGGVVAIFRSNVGAGGRKHGYTRRRCRVVSRGRLAGPQAGGRAWRCNHTMRVRGALRRARRSRSDVPEDGCMCAAPHAAGRAGVPPGHKKRAAYAALENYG